MSHLIWICTVCPLVFELGTGYSFEEIFLKTFADIILFFAICFLSAVRVIMNYSLSHGTPILSGVQIHIAILPYMHFFLM